MLVDLEELDKNFGDLSMDGLDITDIIAGYQIAALIAIAERLDVIAGELTKIANPLIEVKNKPIKEDDDDLLKYLK